MISIDHSFLCVYVLSLFHGLKYMLHDSFRITVVKLITFTCVIVQDVPTLQWLLTIAMYYHHFVITNLLLSCVVECRSLHVYYVECNNRKKLFKILFHYVRWSRGKLVIAGDQRLLFWAAIALSRCVVIYRTTRRPPALSILYKYCTCGTEVPQSQVTQQPLSMCC